TGNSCNFSFSRRISTYTPPGCGPERLPYSHLFCATVIALRSRSTTGRRQGEAHMFIRDLLKNQDTASAEVHQTMLEVAEMMVNRNIGAVPVLKGGQLVGILTERDLMSRVVVLGKDPART